jgi:membrane fusion protein, macrolide-specific efflux system
LSQSPIHAGARAPADHAPRATNGYASDPRTSPAPPPSRGRTRRHITRPQRAGAALIAAACIFAAVWYVPRIASADDRSLAGAVTSSGIVYLNFSSSGQLASIRASIGQKVRKGELLATEAAPAQAAVLSAARAVISADKAELTAELATGLAAGIAAARAQLARDQAALAVDRANAAGSRILAPAAGTVVAVNGQPGETVDADGVRDYAAQSQGTPVTQQPLFSLFPEGPQSGAEDDGSAAGSALPVIALRTSSSWQVSILVPESSVTAVKPGEPVTISVPAADITAVSGRVQALLDTPVTTAQGTSYQAVVTVLDHQQYPPLTGMAADVQLGS